MNRIPSLKLLMGFEAAARLGSFARAAEELCLSQSAISHQVQQLEEQIGLQLFRRKGRGVELTVAGEVLQRSVQRSVESLRSGLGRIATYLDPGLVVLVGPAPILHGWLQPRLEQLQQELPALCPLLSTDESVHYIDEINVDISIGSPPIQQPGLHEVPLFQDEWVMVAKAEVCQALGELPIDQHPQHTGLICLEQQLTDELTGSLFRTRLAGFKQRAIYDDQRLVLDAVERGRGIALLSKLVVESSLQTGKLEILAGYPRLPGVTWWISRVEGKPRTEIVALVFEWLLAQGRLGTSSDQTLPLA
ncbi:LysR family transcriptional regulator [Vogesella sp. LIG4]|uniref:LysR family transcriptional regulator n=1 Tax=Vogesella sp. LIG4 TaxID=1192162 RepID=UPI00081FEF21|nr:LysR family transcriptional regulator [Vogesella sp. LIG4]SCK27526.1 DNA-binding transcriptional regulator, LysR family [Vogesella sp. LIG4]